MTVVGGVVDRLDDEAAGETAGVTDQIQDTVWPLMVAVTHCVCAIAPAACKNANRRNAVFMVEVVEA